MENWIALDINPIVRFRGDVAAQAILFVVGCNLFVGRIRLEEGPTLAIAS
jgi:extradiol dioxygenase family protein